MVRPHRKDGYRFRRRVHVRVADETVVVLDELALALRLSRAHLCDLILGIAVDEGGAWLNECIGRRVKHALRKRREKYE